MKSKKRQDKPSVVMIILESVTGFFGLCGLALMVMLLKMPVFVFSLMHYGWIIGIGVFLFVLTIVFGIIWLVQCRINIVGLAEILIGLCIGFLLIMGLCNSNAVTYNISSAREFSLFTNLPPQKYSYQIEITEDIDFSGYELHDGFGCYDTLFIINGNNHTVKNITYTKTLKEKETVFWRLSNYSQINNLSFSNCVFNLTPDYFSNETHQGYACNFRLIGETYTPSMTNVQITETTLHIYNPPEDIRHTASTFDVFYPENRDDGNCLIKIEVVTED